MYVTAYFKNVVRRRHLMEIMKEYKYPQCGNKVELKNTLIYVATAIRELKF